MKSYKMVERIKKTISFFLLHITLRQISVICFIILYQQKKAYFVSILLRQCFKCNIGCDF